MAITKSDGTSTISTTEFSLPGNATFGGGTAQAVACVMQPFIDASAMLAGDQFQFSIYEKINGTQRLLYQSILTGVQTSALAFPSLVVMDGWDVTAKKLAGTDRSIVWSIRKVA